MMMMIEYNTMFCLMTVHYCKPAKQVRKEREIDGDLYALKVKKLKCY